MLYRLVQVQLGAQCDANIRDMCCSFWLAIYRYNHDDIHESKEVVVALGPFQSHRGR